jgi:hypothetical protein
LVTVTEPQLSLEVGVPSATFVATQLPGAVLRVKAAGALIAGGVLSRTVTVKLHELLLPLESRALYRTKVVPRGKEEPGGKLLEKFVTAQLSEAVGATQLAVAVHRPDEFETVMFPGQPLMRGNSLSVTVTVCVALLVFPLESRAVHRTIVTPLGN